MDGRKGGRKGGRGIITGNTQKYNIHIFRYMCLPCWIKNTVNKNSINEKVSKTSNSIINIQRQTLNFEQLNDRMKI